jgi:arginine repressor
MTEKQTNVQERRELISQLLQEGYNSSRSIAKALKERHGIDLGRSTVARDMEQLQGESKPSTSQGEHGSLVSGYEDRVQRLTEMLDDKTLDKRERLATIRTLNDTSRQLAAYQDKKKDAQAENTDEGKEERSKINLEALKKMAERHRLELLAEIIEELRQEPGGERFESVEVLRKSRDALKEMSKAERANELATFNLSALEKRFLNVGYVPF